tara:strand:- start:31 stop:393 length:363 start_codon:yes stop_codon:yes gene_type:complete
MTREVLQMALEALELIAKIEHPEHKVMMRKIAGSHIVTIYPHQIASAAIAPIKAALAQEPWTPEDTAYRPGGLAQPEREWVGLTDDEISKVLGADIHAEQSGELRFIRAIEVKLKEKNNG